MVTTKDTGNSMMAAEPELKELFSLGVAAVDNGDTVNGLLFLEKTGEVFRGNPLFCSYLAVCLARERQMFLTAVSLCLNSMAVEPRETLHYLNLGRVYLTVGDKKKAIQTFDNGLQIGYNKQIHSELYLLGWRKPPVIPFLDRSRPLNVILGKLEARLHQRWSKCRPS